MESTQGGVVVNRYNHLIHRVEYPRERGYRMEFSPLPAWIYVTITEDEEKDCKYLTVYSRWHMNKEVRINPDYSIRYPNEEMLKELSGEIASRFLN